MLAFVLIATMLGVPTAGIAGWETNGPTYPNVSSLAVSPFDDSVVYAAANDPALQRGGLFRSDDGGRSWALFAQAPEAEIIRTVDVDPFSPQDLAAVTSSGNAYRLYRSEDLGASWTLVAEFEAPGTSRVDLVFSADGSGTAYVDVDLTAIESPRSGPWRRLRPPWVPQGHFQIPMEADIHSLWSAPDGELYWTTQLMGYLGGLAPVLMKGSVGKPHQIANAPCVHMTPAVHEREDPLTIYASCDRVVRSRDGGATWEELSGGPSSPADIELDPARPGVLFVLDLGGGLSRSENGGDDWIRLPGPPALSRDLAISPSGNALYAATDHGVFRHTIRSTRELDPRD